MISLGIRCFGRVQGVFYRASTKEKADELGLLGWVKNEPEGTVLIHVEGTKENVDELINWCRRGPQFARVDKVDFWEEEEEGSASFEVRR